MLLLPLPEFSCKHLFRWETLILGFPCQDPERPAEARTKYLYKVSQYVGCSWAPVYLSPKLPSSREKVCLVLHSCFLGWRVIFVFVFGLLKC